MLVIRMQRVGRKGHAQFRVVVQDSRRTPSSGRVVANLGHYDPHTKVSVLDKEKAQYYLDHGAQPSGRVALLLKQDGIKLPDWVKIADPKKRTVRNPEKLRSNQPAQEKVESKEESSESTDDQPVAPSENNDESKVDESVESSNPEK